MNVPLDRLYHYIQNIAQEIYKDRILIYRFWPHGSKNINDLNLIKPVQSWHELVIFPEIWCNDQEPLDYEFYKINCRTLSGNFVNLLKANGLFLPPTNLNYDQQINYFEKSLLIHSEKRSINLEKYQLNNNLIPVYYWSHAILALDWFRYAQHVIQQKQVKKTFLIYNRAWSGTREYRLRFAELLVSLGLQDNCQTTVNPIEPELGVHYETHQFKNPMWRPSTVLENFFPISTAPSHYSADFDIDDYAATDIEVVLETLFDDGRLHLTEKSLRPIACAQPFILAGTYGSLEYLRSYGFKTFSDVWDESYDLVKDPAERLMQIAELMKYISNWTPKQRANRMAKAQAIADYNRQHFFNKKFFNCVVDELKTNLETAIKELEQCNNYKPWLERMVHLMSYPEITEFLKTNQDQSLPTVDTVNQAMLLAQTRLTEVANQGKI